MTVARLSSQLEAISSMEKQKVEAIEKRLLEEESGRILAENKLEQADVKWNVKFNNVFFGFKHICSSDCSRRSGVITVTVQSRGTSS